MLSFCTQGLTPEDNKVLTQSTDSANFWIESGMKSKNKIVAFSKNYEYSRMQNITLWMITKKIKIKQKN